jgi:hypothetical protein
MIYLKYTLMALVSLPLTLLGLILAPVLPLLAEQRDGWLDNQGMWGRGPRLPLWLDWFMTPDNSLDGDATFERINGRSYLAKVKWLLRNPCYAFGIKYLSVPHTATYIGDNTIKDNDNAKEGWLFVRANNLFQFVWIIPIGFHRCFMVNLGWNVRALVDDNYMPKPLQYQATFVFSPRISGYR